MDPASCDGIHDLWIYDDFVYCTRCGGFAQSKAVKLRVACTGHLTQGGKTALSWFRRGRSPYRIAIAQHSDRGEQTHQRLEGRPRYVRAHPEKVVAALKEEDGVAALEDLYRAATEMPPLEDMSVGLAWEEFHFAEPVLPLKQPAEGGSVTTTRDGHIDGGWLWTSGDSFCMSRGSC